MTSAKNCTNLESFNGFARGHRIDLARSHGSTRIQWMWKANVDLFSNSEPVEWKPYSDVENKIIEEAFQAGQKHAILDDYSIDFKHKVQILNIDGDKQRPIKREVGNRANRHLREGRFTFTPTNPERPFAGLYGWISPFIRGTVKDLNITKKQLPSKDKTVVPMIVEKAALGIIEEGKKVGKKREAEQMAKILMGKKNAGMKEVWKCCANLYSMESFLYQKLNETMRLIGSKEHEQEWRNNIRTLGPFSLLLWDNPFDSKATKRGTIFYRGANLSDQLISIFKEDCSKKEKPRRSFPSFTSCSRNQTKAENFGNVLFIMTVQHAFTVDLEPFSEYPDEEEELLSPGVCFTVERVEFNKNKKKHVIYLNLIQQLSQEEREQISDSPDDHFRAGGDTHYDNYYNGTPLHDDTTDADNFLLLGLGGSGTYADDAHRYDRYNRDGDDEDW